MKIDVIVVGCHSQPYTVRLLDDLEKTTRNPYKLYLFDNTTRGRNLSTVRNELAGRGDGDYILFADGDVIFSPDWDSRLLEVLEMRPDVGAVMPLPVGDPRFREFWAPDVPAHFLADGIPSRETMAQISKSLKGTKLIHLYDTGDFFCPFFAVLLKRSIWNELKGFDERFRLFGADLDFQTRLRRTKGLLVAGVRACGLFHKGGASLEVASSNGLDAALENDQASDIRRQLRDQKKQYWHLLSDDERTVVRGAPEYCYLGGKPKTSGIEGIRTLPIKPNPDARGRLCEIFHSADLPGIQIPLVNQIDSNAGVLRGTHVHREHTDLFVVGRGKALLALQDVRKYSPTFQKTQVIELDGSSPVGVVVPPGVLHGMYFLTESTLITFESQLFDPEEEVRCRWADPEIKISWPFSNAVLSELDQNAPSFSEMMKTIEPWQDRFARQFGFVGAPDKPRLSVVIPTLDRDSLRDTLKSLQPQLEEGDEVIVVGDGQAPGAKKLCAAYGDQFIFAETPETRSWGHAQRNLGMDLAKGDYLWFLDDDDTALPGALETIRQETMAQPGRPMIFRMAYENRILWEGPDLKLGNIGSQMFVFPNIPAKLGRWGRNPKTPQGRGGDYCFARNTALLWPEGSIIWKEQLVAKLTKHGFGEDGRTEE